MTSTRRYAFPHLLPVLDLLDGDVVWGVAGDRESYRPLRTPLCEGAKPTGVARAFRRLVQHDWLYVADLDALHSDDPQWNVCQDLINEGFRLILDAGVRDAKQAVQLVNGGVDHVVIALETLQSRESLSHVVSAIGAERTLFSLDLKRGEHLGDPNLWRDMDAVAISSWAVDQGAGGLIVLDLSGVGVAQGVPTAELCRELRSRHSDIKLITGGGVREPDDVRSLLNLGVDSVLVASAFHRQTIGSGDIASLREVC